ncbi:MAG: hypothetical protein V4685_10740 [Bacteroidota bacterium]
MANLLKIFLCATTVFVFASCGREPLPVYPPVVPDIRLLQYLEIDSVTGTAPDTSSIVKLEYDVLKRLVVLSSYFSTDSADQLLHYERFVYQYNGTDTFPAKMIYSSREGNATDFTTRQDTSYYSYNTLGKILTDSTSRNDSSSLGSIHSYTTRRYNYSGSYFFIYKAEENSGIINQTYDSVAVDISGSNMSSINSQSYSLPDSMPLFSFTGSFSYDNNPNPFRKIAALYPTIQVFEFNGGPSSLLQINNAINMSQNSSAGDVSNETVTYTYNTNGYPSGFQSVYSSTFSGITETRRYKGVFVYN